MTAATATRAVTEVTFKHATPTTTYTLSLHDALPIYTHTTSVAADLGNTLGGTLTMGSVSESATTEPGTVGWTYSVADRKSTRLNSSHLGSSYVALCM